MEMFTSIRHDWWQKGFKQIHGIDYVETFSPIVMLKFVRILLAIAA
jgi:hypothetical protein